MPIEAGQLAEFAYNEIFIETGTGNGLGVVAALEAGFSQIFSIEFYQEKYERAVERFKNNSRVRILKGDSGQLVGKLLRVIGEPVTFWLDAHFNAGYLPKPLANPCPILSELESIAGHSIKTHTILIDDIRCFRSGVKVWGDIKLVRILEALKRVNKEYNISYRDGFAKRDILVARI